MICVQLLPALSSGGVERSTIEIAQALVDAGHRAIVVSAGGRLVPALEGTGATHVTLDIGAKSLRVLRHVRALRRLFAETGVQRTFVKSLALHRQFMNDQFVARLYNKPIAINRDDISGQFDILVSVGISAGQQEMRQQQLMQLLNMGPGLSQTGVMTPDNVYEVLCKLLQGWGFKDFQRYASDPQFVQQMQAQLQQAMQQIQSMQMIYR